MTNAVVAVGLIVLGAAVVADLLFSPGYVRRVRAAVAAGDPGARTGM